MITVKEAKTKKELKAFVKFPFKLYKNSKQWVPPIIREELKTFDKKINPVFNDADAQFFLAYNGNTIVGRVAVIINWLEVKGQEIKKVRFGWIDFIDDIDVTRSLLQKVEEIGKAHNLDTMEGPIGFSNLDKVGCVTKGFDHVGNMITWHNHDYYPKHFEELGLEVGKRYIENKMAFVDIKPEYFRRIQALIKRRYKLKEVNFTNTKDIIPFTDDMFEVFSASHSVLSSFVEITERQREYFKKKFIPFLTPEYVKFVVDENDKLVAFAITTPFYGDALQKMRGKLFPFGFRHIIRARKKHDKVTFYLIGVLPEYQNKGLTAILFNEMYISFENQGVVECYRGPELEENTAIHQIWKNFNPKVFKERCTFVKDIA